MLVLFYGVWVLELIRIARHIGSFSWKSIVFYPILLIFYMLLYALALICLASLFSGTTVPGLFG